MKTFLKHFVIFLKYLVNAVLIVLCFSCTWYGVSEFNHATAVIPFIRGAFWFIIGWVAIFVLIDKIKQKKWPLQW